MSLIKIYQGFTAQLDGLTPIDTVHQSQSYTPIVGVPYQEVFLVPAVDENKFVDGAGYESKGFFQISLKYPSGQGLGAILTRVELYKAHFKSKSSFVQDGMKISLLNDSTVSQITQDGDRLVCHVRFNYRAFVGVL